MTIEERIRQAEAQLAYWEQQAQAAQQQLWMWKGAVEALRGVSGGTEKDEPVLEDEAVEAGEQ